ncbi:lysophospholipid acyltransferase family protein [Desulfamplus magnetovallimortis]|nr:lysophospholipid acyltransferase family protein [Desulfamplus magnetovallimortis]
MGGLFAAYTLLYGVALHYWLFDGKAVKAASAYLRRRFPESSPLMIRLKCYRLFVSQGKQLVDRMAAFSGGADFNFRLLGQDNLEKLANQQKGFVLLTAHAGNWQIAMTTLAGFKKKVYLVMLPEHNAAVKASLGISGEGDFIDTIPPGGAPGDILRMIKLLKEGHIVSFMGDRAYGAVSGSVDFLGEKAQFPLGAFAVAAAAKVPVAVLLASRVGYKLYDVDLTNIITPVYEKGENKKSQLIRWSQMYADILSAFFQQKPYQCFLFYDVWKQ